MKYPCDGCIVDPVCYKFCSKLLYFVAEMDSEASEDKLSIPIDVIKNEVRYIRLLNCATRPSFTMKLFFRIALELKS